MSGLQFWGSSSPHQLLQQQLKKIKCKECKHQASNYFVYNQGFFCTLCFSKLKHVQSVQLLDFAVIIQQSTDKYNQSKKSAQSPYQVISNEIQKKYNALKLKRDSFNQDISTQKHKTIEKMTFLNEACLSENINEPLEELYEPSLRVSSNMSITDILERNLSSLKLKQEDDDTIYQFIEKDVKTVNEVISNKFDLFKTTVENLRKQSQSVIDEYQKELQKLKK